MDVHAAKPAGTAPMSDLEWQTRVDLAACYRLVDRYGMTDLHLNHISARVPGNEEHFLINPFGMMYEEITASSLIKIDLAGNIIANANPEYTHQPARLCDPQRHPRRAATTSAACCTPTPMPAWRCPSLKCGLLPLTQTAMRWPRIAYHDYEGVVVELDEQKRLVENLGDCEVMILRNHGLLASGAPSRRPSTTSTAWSGPARPSCWRWPANSELVQPPQEVIARTNAQLTSSPTPDAKGTTMHARHDRVAGAQAHARSPRSVVQDLNARRRSRPAAGLQCFAHQSPQRLEVLLARRGAPPRQANRYAPAPARERKRFTRSSRTSARRDFREQRYTIAIRHHLHHGRQRGGAETGAASRRWCRRTPAPDRADSGPPPAGSAGADRHPRHGRARAAARPSPAPPTKMGRRTAQAFQRRRLPPAAPASRSRARRGQAPRAASWLRLAHLQPQPRIIRLQPRQYARQHVRRQRRDDAERSRPLSRSRWRAKSTKSRVAARICSARCATSSPVSVSAISPGRRSTSSAPISRSSSRTCMESAGWLIAQSAAARPKWRWRASAAR